MLNDFLTIILSIIDFYDYIFIFLVLTKNVLFKLEVL